MEIKKKAPDKATLLRLFTTVTLALIVLAAIPVQAQAASTDTIVRLTMIPHRSAMGNEKAYRQLVKAIETRTGYTIRWVGSQTYTEVIHNLRDNRADIGYVGAFAYIEAQDDFGVQLIARTLDKKRRAYYFSMIVSRTESPFSDLADLKGKTFAFTDPGSTSGFLFPMVGLQKEGLGLSDFAEVKYVKRHANSLLAVANGQADAGAVSSTALDKVKVDFSRYRILWQSAPIYRGPWIAAKDMPTDQVEAIRKALFQISDSADAPQILKGLGSQGFVAGQDSDYDNVREVRRFMEKTKRAN